MRFVILCIVFAAVLGVSVPTVKACYCSVPEVPRALNRASAVFVGEVIEVIDPRTSDEKASPPGRFYTIRFKVEKSWKGVASQEIEVLSAQGKYGCFAYPPVSKGERYLVYADPLYFDGAFQKGWLIITTCNRTKLLANASADLKKLEGIKNPFFNPYFPRRRRN